MGSRNRGGGYTGGGGGGGGGEEKTTSLDCDVGLGLKVQGNDDSSSYPCKRTMVMSHFSDASDGTGGGGYGGGYGGGGGSLFGNSINNQVVASVSDIYDVGLGAGGVAMKAAPFTASQWQELERQTMIYKYLMTSNVVPPELLLPLTKNTSHVSLSQSNTSGLNLKFSSGSDPEPWRCRRTDGKKWRCSRDVAPDQKYCERHAHKSKPRSRKHVEIQTHNATTTTTTKATATATTTINNYSQIPISHSQSMTSATSYDQTRNIMWLMRGGSDNTIPVSTCNQQRQQQLMHSSSRIGFYRENMGHNKNTSFFHQQYEDKQEPDNLNPYLYNGEYCNSFLDPKMASINDDVTIQTTRHFIDAWSTGEKGGLDGIGNEGSVPISSSRKFPVSSLTLSMSGGNGIDEENEHVEMGIGGMMMESDRINDDEGLKSQWMMSPVSWMNSTPGGPLGEALCLGIAGTTKGAVSNLPSPHGYSNSSATSSCSKGSCEEGSHQFNFIG